MAKKELTDFPVWTGALTGTELLYLVAPGNAQNGNSYSVTSASLFKTIGALPNVPFADPLYTYVPVFNSQTGIVYNATVNQLMLPTGNMPAGGMTGQILAKKSNADYDTEWINDQIGTVTSFSSGNLSPLFTTNVATATTTPALSFALSNANANTWFGNNTGGSDAPAHNSSGSVTKTDDTNVTLVLGGTPNNSVLNSFNLTLGWTGVLSEARGGTGTANGAADKSLSNLSSVAINTALLPASNNSIALGSVAFSWNGFYLGNNSSINWNNGDITINGNSNLLSFAGASNGYTFDNQISISNSGISIRGINTTDSATVAAYRFDNTRATGAAFDQMYGSFYLSDNLGNKIESSRVSTQLTSAVSGSVSSRIYFSTLSSGSLAARIFLDATTIFPATNGSASLGYAGGGWSSLFMSSGSAINIDNGNWLATHTSGILTIGTGDLRVTNAGSNSASVVTVGGTQTLTNKNLSLSQVTGLGSGVATMLASATGATVALSWIIDGGGTTITTGLKYGLKIPFSCTITDWTIGLDQSGSIVIALWKDTQANYPPVVGDEISAASRPTVSTATTATGTPSGWTTVNVAAGDWIFFNVNSITSATWANITLTAVKT